MPESAARKCLVHVYGNHQILPAICAVRYYLEERGIPDPASIEVVTLIANPYKSDHLNAESKVLVEPIVAEQGWPTPLLLQSCDIMRIKGGRYSAFKGIVKRFREALDVDHFDEIFFAHDWDQKGHIVQLAMNAYPQATRIIYGDGFGLVGDYRSIFKSHSEQGIGAPKPGNTNLGHRIRNAYREFKVKTHGILLGRPIALEASKAILILPHDSSGHFLDNKELSVIPRKFVLDIVAECQQALPELVTESRRLMTATNAPRYLLLMAYLSDEGMATVEEEISLYTEIIRRFVPAKSIVLLKPHPLSQAPIAETLKRRLEDSNCVEILSPEFNRYPIELLRDLIAGCQIIAVGTAVLSLRYLYGQEVIYGLTKTLIEKHLAPSVHSRLTASETRQRAQLAALQRWDGQSIFWRG